MENLSPVILYRFLKNRFVKASFIDKLKIVYRPFICPFHDLLKNIGTNETVFDVGCGSGQFALLVAEFTGAKKVKGIDLLPKLIENAHQLLEPYKKRIGFEFQVYDGKDLPKDIYNFDKIFMIDVFHHIPKHSQKDFLLRLSDKIKTGAQLIFKDIDRSHFLSFINKIHDLIFAGESGAEVKSADFMLLAEECGFNVISVRKKRMFLYPHFTCVLEKSEIK